MTPSSSRRNVMPLSQGNAVARLPPSAQRIPYRIASKNPSSDMTNEHLSRSRRSCTPSATAPAKMEIGAKQRG